jgi:mannose-6-phosphate isomerase-like protein (cupin superfamily)
MTVIRTREFRADRSWGARLVATMDGITTKIHWAETPYEWHVNVGEEVFVVLDGVVDMRFRTAGVEKVVALQAGDVFFAGLGCEHVAHPRGEARVLVVEREGSV